MLGYLLLVCAGEVCQGASSELQAKTVSTEDTADAGAEGFDDDELSTFLRMRESYQSMQKTDSAPSVEDPVRELLSLNNRSSYERLRDLFGKGTKPDISSWTDDLVLKGRCIDRWEPERLVDGRADVYLEKVGGKASVYVVPATGNLPSESLEGERTRMQAALASHASYRAALKRYQPLSEQVPSDTALSLLVVSKLKGLLSFTYQDPKAKSSGAEELGKKVLFGFRSLQRESGLVLFVEHNCGSYPACSLRRAKDDAVVPFGSDYRYCYYNRGLRIKRK